MRILVDMNLSPVWVSVLMEAGHGAAIGIKERHCVRVGQEVIEL
jgi:predicted nuclease of predicted toxin-antitoxin system